MHDKVKFKSASEDYARPHPLNKSNDQGPLVYAPRPVNYVNISPSSGALGALKMGIIEFRLEAQPGAFPFDYHYNN